MDQTFSTDAVTATKTLCAHLASARGVRGSDTGAAVHEARRGVLDWIGCALAGSRHDDRDAARCCRSSGKPQATVLGHKLKLG